MARPLEPVPGDSWLCGLLAGGPEAIDTAARGLVETSGCGPDIRPGGGAIDLAANGPVETAVVGEGPDPVVAVQTRCLPSAVLAWAERYDSPL
ncbi:MAG: hypothetical protein OXC00_08075 [Acidimicrobiaceae bacterium]|nr:hypothetical protein [Acidimicrobiaceae bacterium]